MRRFSHFVKKEFLQLSRDRHALLMLFIMPTIFILIMSLALQEGFAGRSKVELDYALLDRANTPASRKFVERFEATGLFRRQTAVHDEAELRALARADRLKFLLIVDESFADAVVGKSAAVSLELAPGLDAPLARLVEAHVRQALAAAYLELALGPMLPGIEIGTGSESLAVRSLYGGDAGDALQPSSVQQNVPAWLLFSMFFVSVPLSTVLVAERTNGTLARLATMRFPRYQVFAGKLLPYFGINLVQVVLMLMVGVYVVPLFGGERLALGNSFLGLALIAASASLAAVCYALLVAQIVRTNEQATIFSGVCNIIMAAIGGIMVPRFLMPGFMQDLSLISPMAWGLEGFLDVLLRDGSAVDVLLECGVLCLFAVVMIVLAVAMARRQPVR